jgi:hypothetical protein
VEYIVLMNVNSWRIPNIVQPDLHKVNTNWANLLENESHYIIYTIVCVKYKSNFVLIFYHELSILSIYLLSLIFFYASIIKLTYKIWGDKLKKLNIY